MDNLTDPRNDKLRPPTPLDDRDAELMRQAGFDSVRVPFAWSWGRTADVPSWATLGWVPGIRPIAGQQWNATVSNRNEASYTYFWVTTDWQADVTQA